MNEIYELKLMNQLAQINRRKLPERILHAKGAGAYGRFRVYMPLADYTKAAFLNDTEKDTPVFVRFSQATGQKGSGDTSRDYRGFAVKFYTEEGNYDLISISTPVYFTRTPEKVPELISALTPSKDTNLTYTEDFWKFVAATPESVPMVLQLYSDKGTLKSYRRMEGHSVLPYVWTSEDGQKFLVRYRWKPLLGDGGITRQEAEFLRGFDPDAAARDLYEALEQGKEVEYELCCQVIPYEQQSTLAFNPLDAVYQWPEDEIPSVAVGKLTLDRAPYDYMAEVEKSAFSPSNLVPGIQMSFDPLLKVLAYTCTDAQRYRLGGDYESIQVNRARARAIRKEDHPVFPGELDSETIKALTLRENDFFTQAGEYYRNLSERDQDHLIDNITEDMMFVEDGIQEQVVGFFYKVDTLLAERIAKSLSF